MSMMGGKGGGKKGARPAGGPPQSGTVRYEDATTAQTAAETLNGSVMSGCQIQVVHDAHAMEGRRVRVSNIPSEVAWQEIKDHFNQVGRVQFADLVDPENMCSVAGTVRYGTAEEAQMAISTLNGTFMNGSMIEVQLHGGTKDQTKISINGMPHGTEWQEVKDFFGQIGAVLFSEAFNPNVKQTGEIRYEDPGHADQALKMLNGSMLGGSPISIEPDNSQCWDGSPSSNTRLIVRGIPLGIAWQELKDHFKQVGPVAFGDIQGGKGSKGGKGKGKDSGKGGCGKEGGKGGGMNMMNPGGMPAGMQVMGPGMNMQNMPPGGMVMIPAEMFNSMMQGMGGMGGMGCGGQQYGQAKGSNKGGCGAKGGGKGGGGYGSPYGGGQAPMQSMPPTNQMSDPPGSGRVLVRGFDFQTTEEQLLQHLGQAGQIFKADWITDGSIEVVYQTRDSAQQALGLDRSTIAGNRRFIDVRMK